MGVDQWQPAALLFDGAPTIVADFLSQCNVSAVSRSSYSVVGLAVKAGQQLIEIFSGKKKSRFVNAAVVCLEQPNKVATFLRNRQSGEFDVGGDGEFSEVDSFFVDIPSSAPLESVDLASGSGIDELNDVFEEDIPDMVVNDADDEAVPGANVDHAAARVNPVTRLAMRVPASFEAMVNELLPIMLGAHVYSRPLSRLKPVRFLVDENKIAWKQAMVAFYNELFVDIQKWKRQHNELLLLNMVLKFIQFPAMVLLNLTKLTKVQHETVVTLDAVVLPWVIPSHIPAREAEANLAAPGSKSKFTHACTTAKTAISLYNNGRRKKANKMLTSNGVSQRSDKTRDALRSLVVQKQGVFQHAEVSGDVPFNKNLTAKQLKDSAMSIGNIDVYGWCSDMLSLVCNVPAMAGSPSPLQIHAEFIGLLALTSKVPTAVAFVLAAGVHTPLNKVTAQENESLIANGFLPKVRPIVTGSMPMKQLGKNLLNSDHARSAQKRLRPVQLGVSTKNGCDKGVHSLRGAFNAKKAALLFDARNAFNAM